MALGILTPNDFLCNNFKLNPTKFLPFINSLTSQRRICEIVPTKKNQELIFNDRIFFFERTLAAKTRSTIEWRKYTKGCELRDEIKVFYNCYLFGKSFTVKELLNLSNTKNLSCYNHEITRTCSRHFYRNKIILYNFPIIALTPVMYQYEQWLLFSVRTLLIHHTLIYKMHENISYIQ